MAATRKVPIKSTLLSAAVFILLFSSFPAQASPLRIWVMPNEPRLSKSQINASEVQEFIDRLRDEDNLIIENSVQNMLYRSGVDNDLPLANYIIGQNQIFDELREFRTQNSDRQAIAIEFIRWSDALNRLLTADNSLPLDQLPDIVQTGSTWIASLAHKGLLENLKEYFNEDEFFRPSVDSAHPYGMKGLYAAPWFADTRVLFYWKDSLPEKALTDWQSFRKECPHVLSRDPSKKGVIGFALESTWNLLHNLAPLIWAGGGDILEAHNIGPLPMHRVLLDRPPSLWSISLLSDLSANRYAGFENDNNETLEDHFLKGDYASIITGPWFISRLSPGWEKDIALALPPKGPAGVFPFVGGSHLGIWHAAKQRGNYERALQLIHFLTGIESQKRFSAATNLLPARKETLATWADRPYKKVLMAALNHGRSYPAIAEWGTIVENEFTRNHLWQLWQAISQGQPMEILEGMVKGAALSLRKRIAVTIWDKNRGYVLLVGSLVALMGGAYLLRSRRRNRSLETQLDKTQDQLLIIEGERTALQGQLLLLERKEKRQSHDVDLLRKKIGRLGGRAQMLSQRISLLQAKHQKASKPLIGEVKVCWNGCLLANGEKVCFENTHQAHRLIEHLARQMANGVSTVSCLWGYALFGWDVQKLQSMPNRLFNTAVAKINASLTALGRPAFLKSEGRKSWRWRCLWAPELFLKNCDITKAVTQVSLGRQALALGDAKEAAQHMTQALQIDPKCLEAIGLLSSLPDANRSDLNRLLLNCHRTISEDVAALNHGAKALELLLQREKHTEEHEEYKELMEQEMIAMKHLANHLLRCIEDLSSKTKQYRQPLQLADTIRQLSSVQLEIASLKASGVAEKGVWATIVQSENFLGLLSIPKVQSMVNRFYNYETKMIEDPRLVQLALVLMLSQPQYLETLERARTEEEFFGGFEKQLQRQFQALEQQISLLPPH